MKTIILFFVNLLVKLRILTPIWVARLKFGYKLHRWPEFEHPKDLNEKINWLKFYGDTSQWPMLADKYAVREYVKECGLEECLIPLIGKWNSVDDINWEGLPQQFVMKCNNGSGDVVICKNKEELNKEETLRYFRKQIDKKYGILTGETHYALIKPCIIVEELLEDSSQLDGNHSLIDYKIWCFDGKSAYIVCYSNRHDKYDCEIGVYDTEWNSHPEFLRYSSHYKKEKAPIKRPLCLQQMLDIASRLSKGIPQVRVDLYEVAGKVYFGEMTMTSSGGYMAHFTQDFLDKMGKLTVLPA
ncbi:MAG: glycosyltransferase [Prevotella sp.]|nr:glycosyltransferase [Prevotella sp.]